MPVTPPPPNLRSRLARRRSPLLLLAAALAALAVFFVDQAPPASAEHTGNRTVWITTLTVKDIGSDSLGCLNDESETAKKCSTGTTLTDDEFDVPDARVGIRAIYLSSSGLELHTKHSAQRSALQAYTLFVDGVPFRFANAANYDVAGSRWASPGLAWSEGDTVRLWLTVDLSALNLPTLTASISGDPVEGGEAVTLTLTLSEPVDVATSMQRRVGGTAAHYTTIEPWTRGDYHWVHIPTFAAGGTTATTQIRAVDDNEVEGCETITWAMTMWPGTYRAVHLFYKVYIEDNDGGTPCVVLKAQDGVPGLAVTEAPTDYVVPGYTKPAGSPGSAGDGAAGGLLPAPESGQAPGQAPRGTAGQAPDAQQGDGNGNSDPPPSGALRQGQPESPSGGLPEPEPTPEQTAEERLIAEIAGDDGCVSQDERMAGATRIQKADLTTINQSQAYRMFRDAYC